jgi:hypothetical protein
VTNAPDDPEDDVDVFEHPDPDRSTANGSATVPLPSAEMLTVEDADALLRWRAASLVAIVGERKGGKTTLVSEIYERFLRGPFAGCYFTHSLSLLGFERKNFQSRAVSEGQLPDTPRTSAGDGLRFFHLAVSDSTNLQRTDLLVSERAGEVYRAVRDTPARAGELLEVCKARTVVFIIDGERVVDGRRRAEAFASVRSLARALADTGAIPANASIQTVTTKCDLLGGDGEVASAARAALDEFEKKFMETYSEKFSRVSAFRTAARDPKGIVEPGFGVAPLLRSWLEPKPKSTRPLAVSTPIELIDEFDRLLLRVGDR